MSESSTYPLRLPRAVKAAAEKMARKEGISMSQFVATAVAEKLAAMGTAAFFLQRKQRADWPAFQRQLNREGRAAAPFWCSGQAVVVWLSHRRPGARW